MGQLVARAGSRLRRIIVVGVAVPLIGGGVAGSLAAPAGADTPAVPPATVPTGPVSATTVTPSTATTLPVGTSAAGTGAGGTVPPPAVPAVPASITAGQSAEALLNNAVALSTAGQHNAPLMNELSQLQARLDADTVAARQAEAAAVTARAQVKSAQARANAAEKDYQSLAGAIRKAAVEMYMDGVSPQSFTMNVTTSQDLADAITYEQTTLSPAGLLAKRRQDVTQKRDALQVVDAERAKADDASAAATAALNDAKSQEAMLQQEVGALGSAQAGAVTEDHLTLAQQAGANLVSANSLEFSGGLLPQPSTTAIALAWAFSELGKPYLWGGTGPDSFDCSGLMQYIWGKAGVSIPRTSEEQDAWAVPVPLSQLLPGDLVFFGTTDIHHVGIYIGNGMMINAPHTGTVVQVSSIWWSDLNGFGRVHGPGVSVPGHSLPTVSSPAAPQVISSIGLVPSQPGPAADQMSPPTTPPVQAPPTTTAPTSDSTVQTPPLSSPDSTTTTTIEPPPTTPPVADTTSTTSTTTTVPSAGDATPVSTDGLPVTDPPPGTPPSG